MRTPTSISRSTARLHAIEIMVVLLIVGLIGEPWRQGLRVARQERSARGDRAPVGRDPLPVRPRVDHREVPPAGDRCQRGPYWAEVSDDKFYAPSQPETEGDQRKRRRPRPRQDEDAAARRPRSSDDWPTERQLVDDELRPDQDGVGEFRPKRARFARLQGDRAEAGAAEEQRSAACTRRAWPTRSPAGAPTSISSRWGRPSRPSSPVRRIGRDHLLAGGPPHHGPGAHLQPGGQAAPGRRYDDEGNQVTQ